MPIYVKECENGHRFEVFRSMAECLEHDMCAICSKIGKIVIQPTYISGGQITEATRKTLVTPFGRSRAKEIKTVKDIERGLKEFHQKYPHLGSAGRAASED